MLFEFKIYDREIIKSNKSHITNIDKYNKCRFYFDEQTWKNKELFVTFINKNGYAQTVILGKWAETLTCTIPDNILTFDYFKIFAYAKDLFKTNTLKVEVKTPPCASKPKSNDAINYLLEKLDTKIDNIIFEDNQLKCYSGNNLIDTIYIDNVDETIVKKVVDEHFEEIQDEIEKKLDECMTDDDIDYLIISL